jgi:type III secretion protein V
MVVTRVASEDEETNIGSDIATQILAKPKAIGVAAVILLVMSLIPGMPKVAFLLLAVVTGGTSYSLYRAMRIKTESQTEQLKALQKVAPPPSADLALVKTHPLIIELGGELASLVAYETKEGKAFFDKMVKLRDTLYKQLGVVFPPLRVNRVQLAFEEGNNYRFWLNEAPISTGRIRADRVMVNASVASMAEYGVEAEPGVNPANFQPAAWINRSDVARVSGMGIKVWDTDEVVLLHISAFLREHAKDFITMQEVNWMVSELRKIYPTLVEEVVPKMVSLQQLTDILRRLLDERVGIRDFRTILQSIAEWSRIDSGDTVALTEHARVALKRRICFGISEGRSRLVVYQLDPAIEDMIRDSVRQGPAGAFLAMDYEQSEMLIEAIRSQIGDVPTRTQNPVLVVDSAVRRFIRSALGGSFPEIHALSYNELAAEIAVEPIGTVSLNSPPELEEERLALT